MERLDQRVDLGEHQRARVEAGPVDQAVQPAGGGGRQRGPRAVAAHHEPDAEHQAADDLRREVGGHEVDQRQVEEADPREVGDAEHRGHDRREHDLEDGHVVQVELRRQLARAAEAGALQGEPEPEADDERPDQARLDAEQAVLKSGAIIATAS